MVASCGLLFISLSAICALVILFTGLVMFASPARYVAIVNWYFSKVGFERRASIETYSRWPQRISGLMLAIASFPAFYMFWLLIKNHLR